MNSNKLEDKILSYRNKTISKYELQKILGSNDDAELFEQIQSLLDILEPIKSSGTNGNHNFVFIYF